MELFEKIKEFLKIKNPEKISPEDAELQNQNKIIDDLSKDDIYNFGNFFDGMSQNTIFKGQEKQTILEKQKAKIMLYRNLAKISDVYMAVDEIVNEIVHSDDKDILKISIDEENEKIQDAITEKFEKIVKLFNNNFYNVVKQAYVDGQIVIKIDFNDEEDGIKGIKIIEPVYLYFDKSSEQYKYMDKSQDFYRKTNIEQKLTFSKEEIIRQDFGIHEDNINLGYLEFAIKPANQLKMLEDLLIPMRFSRSISRRVFNVDVGELSNTKAEEAMRDAQKKFKYKKFYNTETGEITNQQHITSMVEDYWFANRSGAKGTQVDLLDETGNLGELGDILYFQKKLYQALFIPANRIPDNTDADQTFDYDSTQVTKSDIKFYMFINRIRKIFIEVINDLLKRELILSNIMTLEDYEEYKEKINVQFMSDSLFIEKMKLAQFQQKLDIYSNVQDYSGKLFPVQKVLKEVFNFTDEEILDNFKQIAKEKKNKMFEDFYKTEDDY